MIIRQLFLRLTGTSFQVSSPVSGEYNCIAWAAQEDDRWWWPDRYGMYYWPADARREETLTAFVDAFRSFGYEACTSPGFEVGFEKVAIFTDQNGEPTHMARQLQNGSWTSKLGTLNDIEHDLYGVEGNEYAQVALILRRRIEPTS
jgi:hypothetical protein